MKSFNFITKLNCLFAQALREKKQPLVMLKLVLLQHGTLTSF